ncbi:adult cuticle protein 1 [Culex quinquefasciatus]|uniref:adult cuticle protein 1 n=1 Tax=Culex quinquefasciatus TaxID=7176 RepID=UPI0018E34E75|nr:adult cuticle protein 1 [Culex quinquefasciatus]
MKCIAAVVMMALAVVAEAGLAPVFYGAAAVAYPGHTTVVQGNQADPKQITELPAITYSAPALTYSYPALQPAYYPYAGLPLTYAAPLPAIAAPAVVYQKEARYLAANRGAVHEAPLAGHTVSQQSLNLEPAAESH